MSIDEVSSLTVPRLKAELTRLNQPIGGLKRKAQFVEALTVSAVKIVGPLADPSVFFALWCFHPRPWAARRTPCRCPVPGGVGTDPSHALSPRTRERR